MKIRPFLRFKKIKDLFELEQPDYLTPEVQIVPESIEICTKLLMAPSIYYIGRSAFTEYLDPPFTRYNRIQGIWLCMVNGLIQGLIAGAGMLNAIHATKKYFLGIPLAVFGVYSIDQESYTLFSIYSGLQVLVYRNATKIGASAVIPSWILPGFFLLMVTNCSVYLHVMYRLGMKEFYMLRIEKMLVDMQFGGYKHGENFSIF